MPSPRPKNTATKTIAPAGRRYAGGQVKAATAFLQWFSEYVSENCRRASDVSGDESINVTAWRLPHAPRVVIPPI